MILATGAGALSLSAIGRLKYPLSGTQQHVKCGSTQRAVPSAQADNTQLPSGVRHVPGPARFESRRYCVPMTPETTSRCVPWSHGMRPRTWWGLPRGPECPVGSLRPQGGLSKMPPQPRAIFRKIGIALGENLELTPRCTRFIISVTSASSSLRNRQVAPLMPGPESPRWDRPLPSSIRPRLAKFSGF